MQRPHPADDAYLGSSSPPSHPNVYAPQRHSGEHDRSHVESNVGYSDVPTRKRSFDSLQTYAQSTTTVDTTTSRSSRLGLLFKGPKQSGPRAASTSSSSTAAGRSSTEGASGSKPSSLLTSLFKSKQREERDTEKEREYRKLEEENEQRKITAHGGDQEKVARGTGTSKNPKSPVKTVPSGKEPVVTFADLAYRYGSPTSGGQPRF